MEILYFSRLIEFHDQAAISLKTPTFVDPNQETALQTVIRRIM